MPDTHPIALLAAITDEIKPTLARLGLSRRDDPLDVEGATLRVHRHNDDDSIIAVVCGIGATRAIAAMDWIVEHHRPARVIHLGFAGALDPQLKVAQTPSITTILNAQGDRAQVTAHGQDDLDVNVSDTLLTLDHIADSPQAKQRLHESHGAAIVDMESYHVANRSAEHGVSYIPLRAVSDTADMTLPAEAVNWVNADGTPNIAAAMKHVMFRPKLMRTLMTLQDNAKSAAQVLADRAQAIVADGGR